MHKLKIRNLANYLTIKSKNAVEIDKAIGAFNDFGYIARLCNDFGIVNSSERTLDFSPIIYSDVSLLDGKRNITTLDYVIEEQESVLLVKKFFGGGKETAVRNQEDKKDKALRKAVDYLRRKFGEDLRGKKLYGLLYNSTKKEGRIVEFS